MFFLEFLFKGNRLSVWPFSFGCEKLHFMPEPLKNMYNPRFFEVFTSTVKLVLPNFNKQHFLHQVFDTNWEQRELKQRVRHISSTLKEHLPGSYKEEVNLILGIIKHSERTGIKGGFEYMFFPDFIEQYGLDDLDTSLKAIEKITQFISCEFAIRPFLLKYQNEVMAQMLKWSRHPHDHVRRFSSEGCRPRLPWAVAIPALKKDPSPILPILENLKNDASLFVRKSVANNLNDIAKDHPQIVVQLAKKWKGQSKETDWIIKHGSRTLLKQADKNIYQIFGLNNKTTCEVKNLKLSKSKIKIGDRLGFSFALKATDKKTSKLRVEYAVYYVKANGKQSRKLFKLAENNYEPDNIYSFKKEQRFQDFTTRKHFPGKHKIGIIVNGQELATKEFMLLQQ
jgi:3-methyladenine DNA glycosylase AlkC